MANSFGTKSEDLREMAKELRDGKNDLDFHWKSEEDKEDFAQLLNKLANFIDEVPQVHGAFSLGMNIHSNSKYNRLSPTITVNSAEIKFDSDMSKRDRELMVECNQLDMILKQISSVSIENEVPIETTIAGIVEGYINGVDEEHQLNLFYALLGGPLAKVGEGKIQMTKEGMKNLFEWTFGEMNRANREANEEDDDDDDDSDDELIDIIKKIGEQGEDVVVEDHTAIVKIGGKQAKKVLSELAKSLEEEEESESTGGKCDCDKCTRKSKCSGKNKKS